MVVVVVVMMMIVLVMMPLPDEMSDVDILLGSGGLNSPRRGELERSMHNGLSFSVFALIFTNVSLLKQSGRTDDGIFSLQRPANCARLAALHDASQQQNKSQLSLVKSQVQLPNEGSWVPSRETLTVLAAAGGAGGVDEELL